MINSLYVINLLGILEPIILINSIDNATARDRVFQSRQISIDLSTLCNRWGWLPTAVRREIQNLEWDKPNLSASSVHARRTGVNVSFSEWSWWLWLHGTSLPASPTLLDQCLSCLMSRLIKVEQVSVFFNLFKYVACTSLFSEATVCCFVA
ncbi:unnamed protein product [Protopolystoma xenopodis]|uniref:Uncharacterized protein n=1 Tax=Protopolystoma xenopodis TaxID=117903 RepID=A0A448XK86_9PLAT|nr:unnamed protein product [Protopolystoma xenopodis]